MLLIVWSSMGELRRSWCACIAAQLLLLWSCGSAQNGTNFLSIDCGSSAPYTDNTTRIEWTSDAGVFMADSEVVSVEGLSAPLNTARIFTGNHSKYCYRLANSAVTAGAFFLVRAWVSMGIANSPYPPKSSDGYFYFKLLIDANEWRDVSLANGSSQWSFYEAYIRALHDSIDVCVARTTPDGDHPFISAIELRPLPDLLSATRLMSTTNLNFISVLHDDSGVSGSPTRYPLDPFDRFWQSDPSDISRSTRSMIDTSQDQDKPPSKVLQTAVSFNTGSSATWTYYNRPELNTVFYCVFYFAEIDPEVNATGQRAFDIVQGGKPIASIDVFKEVGAFASYEVTTPQLITDQQGSISFEFSPSSTSIFPPLFGATELFRAASIPFSNGTFPNDVMAIEELKSTMKLSSYIGDPCLPTGFGYSWLACIDDATSTGASRIINMSV